VDIRQLTENEKGPGKPEQTIESNIHKNHSTSIQDFIPCQSRNEQHERRCMGRPIQDILQVRGHDTEKGIPRSRARNVGEDQRRKMGNRLQEAIPHRTQQHHIDARAKQHFPDLPCRNIRLPKSFHQGARRFQEPDLDNGSIFYHSRAATVMLTHFPDKERTHL